MTATVSNAARVEARATAAAGSSGVPFYNGIQLYGATYQVGGTASADATAQGLGEVVASSLATGSNSPTLHARSAALSTGPLQGVIATLDAEANAQQVEDRYELPNQALAAELLGSVTTAAALRSAAPLASAPTTHAGEAHVYGAPSASDVAAWTAGNPNATAAIAKGSLLALGSVVGGGNAANSYLLSGIPEGSSLNTISYSGALEADLTSAAIDPTAHVALAFLDPISSGLGFDALHLTLSRAGEVLFDRSYASPASALADLDDHVFYLGSEAAPGSAVTTPLVLSFSFELPSGNDATSFAFDVAMLKAPEPAPLLLALAALAVVSRRRAACRPT